MRQTVENDPNSIGFVSNYQSDKGGVHAVERQRRGVQQEHRHLRCLPGHGPLLRGHQRPGHRCRLGVHRLDPQLLGGAQDHLDPVGARHLAAARGRHGSLQCWRDCASHGPTRRAERTLGAVSCLVGVARRGDGRVRRRPRLAHLRAQRPELARIRRKPGIQLRKDAGHGREPARLGLSPARLAAALRHAADDRRRRSRSRSWCRCSRRSSSSSWRRSACAGSRSR